MCATWVYKCTTKVYVTTHHKHRPFSGVVWYRVSRVWIRSVAAAWMTSKTCAQTQCQFYYIPTFQSFFRSFLKSSKNQALVRYQGHHRDRPHLQIQSQFCFQFVSPYVVRLPSRGLLSLLRSVLGWNLFHGRLLCPLHCLQLAFHLRLDFSVRIWL